MDEKVKNFHSIFLGKKMASGSFRRTTNCTSKSDPLRVFTL